MDHFTKTWLILAAFMLLAFNPSLITAIRCNLTPEGTKTSRSKFDANRYEISISGHPKGYAPGETYSSTTVFA